jgi:hypothetical protein
VNVRVHRIWSPLRDGAVSPPWLAHQAEELDVQLADWQLRYPRVGLTTAIETAADWLDRMAADTSLLVVPAGSADLPAGLPTAVVPR